ncbi:hypothetical protein D9M72_319410 [compost metagenome]
MLGLDQFFVERQPCVCQRVLEGRQPGVSCRHIVGVIEHADPGVPGVDQGLHGRPCAAHFVGDDGGNSVADVFGVHQDCRQSGQVLGDSQLPVIHRGVQDAVHLPVQQIRHLAFLGILGTGAGGVDDHDAVAAGPRRFLGPEDDPACVRGGGDFLADEPDHP